MAFGVTVDFNANIAKFSKDINKIGNDLDRFRKKTANSFAKSQASVKNFNSMIGQAKSALTGLLVLKLGSGLVGGLLDANREMESLRAQLKSITGSELGSSQAFDFIIDFAKNTPFQVQGLTKAFVDLKNFGIEPTEQVMQSITDQSAKLGGSQLTLAGITTALGQAYAKGKLQQEEMLQLAERGVPIFKILAEVTGKNGDELAKMSEKGLLTKDTIDQVIIKMGELASGSNATAMETLNGKISNLSDSWTRFQDVLVGGKTEGLFKSIVGSITDGVGKLSQVFDDSLEANIKRQQQNIKFIEQGGSFEKIFAGLLGSSLSAEKTILQTLITQKTTQQEKATLKAKELANNKTLAREQEKIAKSAADQLAQAQKLVAIKEQGQQSRADSIIQNNKNEQELLNDKTKEYKELLASGKLTQDQFNRALARANELVKDRVSTDKSFNAGESLQKQNRLSEIAEASARRAAEWEQKKLDIKKQQAILDSKNPFLNNESGGEVELKTSIKAPDLSQVRESLQAQPPIELPVAAAKVEINIDFPAALSKMQQLISQVQQQVTPIIIPIKYSQENNFEDEALSQGAR